MDLIDMKGAASRLPEDNRGVSMRYILNIRDHHTKYLQLFPLPDKTADNVLRSLLQWINAFGRPAIVQTDNGREFRNWKIEDLLAESNVDYLHGRPYHPQSQGGVEQANGVVQRRIHAFLANGRASTWLDALPLVLRECALFL